MFPRTIRACVLMLVACCGHADAEPAQTEALRFQQNLLAVLECRASADTRQTVASTLRAARYGDPAGRPLHLRDWHFEQAGDADAASVTVIDMPVPLTVQGVRTQRVFAGAQGLSIAIDAAARDRIVARHGLQLQSSTLREPFRVWTARPVDGNASAASIMVSSDGDGYRLGCTAAVASTQGTLPLDRQQRADANDLTAAIECRADDAALRRVGRLLQQVMEQPQSEWPAEVHAVSAPTHAINGTVLPVFQIELQTPLQIQGITTDKVLAAPAGLIAADLGRINVAGVLLDAGLTTAHQQAGVQVWQREASRSGLPSGSIRIHERMVARADDGTVLTGCSSSQMRAAASDPQSANIPH
ncbi:hypothetical protein [Stenotrophomonas indicatrix]|uniref:hypothetical protein n=1 Tax=Stenotrophomonas indicatrix TaxID=2045451 RepID=UPI000C18F5F7|nr:hypothetical protein [Stenotrophomonas indicatrix]PII12999.1 hypothetical protein CR918_15320 [Stenotrophomonas indicatrix]